MARRNAAATSRAAVGGYRLSSIAMGESVQSLHVGRPVRVDAELLVLRRRDDDSDLSASGRGTSRGQLLSEAELTAIEETYGEGITAVQIVDVFSSRGLRLSEASFRKYVQQGLLPRSKRVGRKGKHRGSLGVYPSKVVRRINTVKQLMADGHTIEEIQGEFLVYTDLLENAGESLNELTTRLDADLGQLPESSRRAVTKELTELRREGTQLVARLEAVARRISAPRTEKSRRSGAAGSAEDLL